MINCDPAPATAVEVLNEAEYIQHLEQQRQFAEHDRSARAWALDIIRKYEAGFTPNLLPTTNLLPFDAILASKVIIKLLQLSLAEDARCHGGESRSPYLRRENRAIAQECGNLLYQMGGTTLMSTVIYELIPAFDQSNLSSAWQGIGSW
ncbi:MAG: hypothetical protein F6K19_33180 [Cyanothece sp. SIO1E1]|nr:hypothetical protein [Cyanothece sp. SIO1E1]